MSIVSNTPSTISEIDSYRNQSIGTEKLNDLADRLPHDLKISADKLPYEAQKSQKMGLQGIASMFSGAAGLAGALSHGMPGKNENLQDAIKFQKEQQKIKNDKLQIAELQRTKQALSDRNYRFQADKTSMPSLMSKNENFRFSLQPSKSIAQRHSLS